MKPVLILIHGLPATGKTSISKVLSEKLNLPLVSKDTYKEKIFDGLKIQTDNVEFSKELGSVGFEIAYAVIEELLSKGISCITETCWSREFAEPIFKEILSKYDVKLIQLFLKCDHEVRVKRSEDRAITNRHAAHMDIARIRNGEPRVQANSENNKPLDLGGTLIEIDTTSYEAVDAEKILEEVSHALK